MKHLKKFNENNNIDEDSISDLLNTPLNVSIPLFDLLSQDYVIIRMKSGEIYELKNGELYNTFKSHEEFKEETGASLDNEFVSNKSEELLNFIKKGVEYDPSFVGNIETIYFEGNPSSFIKKIIDPSSVG